MADQLWKYKAETADGKLISGQVSARSTDDVIAHLNTERLTPLTIKKQKANSPGDIVLFEGNAKLKISDYASFTRSLADLVKAGVPLSEALLLIEKRTNKNTLKRFLSRLQNHIRAGSSLSRALEQDEQSVPRLMIALIHAGEASSSLDEQLNVIADTFEEQNKFQREITGQLIYPLALLTLVILTLVFLSFFVLPQFETIFLNADSTPPRETQIVLFVGSLIRQYGFLFPITLGGLWVLGVFLRKRHAYAISNYLLKAPFIGSFLLKSEAGKFSRSLGALLTGGTSLSKALPIAEKAITSPYLKDKFQEASKQIRAGKPLSSSLSQNNLAPKEVLSLAEIGETTSDLGPMLTKAAELCEDDIKSALKRLTTLSGPILTALMGLITALVIASVMSGVLSLNDAIY